MKKIFTRITSAFVLLFIAAGVYAQNTTVSGTVTDKSNNEALAGVTVTIKGKSGGTTTNENGRFSLTTSQKTPFTLVISYIGYKTAEQSVSSSGTSVNISLEQGEILGQEVVVAASRTPERILESPVSIERVNAAAIRESTSPSFYDAIPNLKGVESSVQSLTFRSINTRGFNANGNTRFNQYVDGMDNQAPGLNFSVGNIVGISDLDADNVELLPGASSALYGAGGTNGTLLMTSKSPFTYQGLSAQYKIGQNHVDNYQRNQAEYRDFALRYAKAWNNRLAVKVNLSYLTAADWQGTDYRNFDRAAGAVKSGDRNTDPLYDGVNVYGDEPNSQQPTLSGPSGIGAAVSTSVAAATGGAVPNAYAAVGTLPLTATPAQIGAFLNAFPAPLRPTIQALIPISFADRSGLLPTTSVTRTGYLEKDLVDYDTKSIKTSGALHYKISNSIEAIAQANWGTGTSVYTGSDRYSLRNFSIGQYKLELRGSNFFLRGYTTQERSGQAYNATLLGTYINELTAPSSTWYTEYAATFSQARLQGASAATAHSTARTFADRNRAQPGTQAFETAKESVASRTIGPAGGAKFNDKSNMYHYEGMYNFSEALKVLELQVGASTRTYDLKSDGTIFDDLGKKLTINEYGAFVQAGKKLFADKFKLTAAVRYDKNENFDGRFTPRFSGVYTVAANNNIRVSYQTGFRNPTTQNQYIDLLVGGASGTRLIGGLPSLINKYDLNGAGQGYTLTSVNAFKASGNPALLQKYTFGDFKPESVQAYEIGYKGLFGNKLLIDAYYYYNSYKDFLSTLILIQPGTGVTPTNPFGTNSKVFSTVVNNPDKVSSQGAALGLDYALGKYNISGNVSYNALNDNGSSLQSEFNTPKYRYNLGLGNREIFKNTGFNVAYRWQDAFLWNSTFAAGTVDAFSTIDGQVSYRIPYYKTTIKLGGSNLLNHYYRTSFGNPQVGAVYYMSLVFDQFLK